MKLEGKQLVLYALRAVLIAIGLGIVAGWLIFLMMINVPNVGINSQQCLTLIAMVVYMSIVESEFCIIRRISDKYKVIKTLLIVHFGMCLSVLLFMLIMLSIRFVL